MNSVFLSSPANTFDAKYPYYVRRHGWSKRFTVPSLTKEPPSTPSTYSSTRTYPTGEITKYPTAPATPRVTTLTTPASCSTVLRGTGGVYRRRAFVRPINSYRNRAGKCLTWSSVIWLRPSFQKPAFCAWAYHEVCGIKPCPALGRRWLKLFSIRIRSAHTLRLRRVALHSPESNSWRLYAAINWYLPTSTLMF